MAVISLTVTNSSEQTISGIPDTVTVSSNVPCIIFFTLNGEDPSFNSSVYIGPIRLPIHLPSVTLKIKASDGTDSSLLVSETFYADLSTIKNITDGARFPQTTVVTDGRNVSGSLFPFGNSHPSSNSEYTGDPNPSNTVYNESLTSIPNGYDANGNEASFTNEPIGTFDRPLLNKNVTLIGKNGPTEYTQEYSSTTDKLFNPKALVIFHDTTNTDPSSPVIINRSNFSLENPEMNGGSGLSLPPVNTATSTGSFISSHYNARTGMVKSYYRDSATNRWIISQWQYTPTGPVTNGFTGLVFGREPGSRYVFPWTLWPKRTFM